MYSKCYVVNRLQKSLTVQLIKYTLGLSSLEAFQARLDRVLGSLIYCVSALPIVGGWN